MKNQQLKPLLFNFITTNVNEKENSKTPSIDLYNYFCLKNRINSEEFSIFSFIPHFVKTFETVKNKKLTKAILKDNNGKVYRGYKNIELNVDKDLAAVLNSELTPEILVEPNVETVEISPKRVKTAVSSIIEQKQDLTQVSSQQKAQTVEQENISSKSSKAFAVKKEKFNDYEKVKTWLKVRCINAPEENVYVHLLVEDFVSFINTKDEINNRSFINHLMRYSEEEWPDSNIKKEDKLRKSNSSYITNLRLRP